MFDLLIALAQLYILGLRSGVMLEDEALKSRYIIRQSVDIEHGQLYPQHPIDARRFAYFYRCF